MIVIVDSSYLSCPHFGRLYAGIQVVSAGIGGRR